MVLVQTFPFLFGNHPIHKIGIIPVKTHQLRTCSPALASEDKYIYIYKTEAFMLETDLSYLRSTTRRLGPQPCFLSPRTRSVWVFVKVISSLVGWQMRLVLYEQFSYTCLHGKYNKSSNSEKSFPAASHVLNSLVLAVLEFSLHATFQASITQSGISLASGR